jgi:malate/lactate dehydrogenase
MKVALVGIGNVGSGLLYFLSANPHLDTVFVMSRSEDKSRAAIMDVASVRPRDAAKLVPSPYTQMSQADVVVLTAGATPEAVPDRNELYRLNCTIVEGILTQSELAPSTTLILLATPVDDVAAFAQRRTGLPANLVIGFGGDLDRNRLASVLLSRGKPAEGIHIVGEHGRKTIPVYPGEEEYVQVAAQVRRYLATIIELAGPPRNLATSVLLDELIRSIATDARRTHHVCGYHGELGAFLTWPFTVGRKGLIAPQAVRLEKHAQADLDKLLEERRYRDEMLGYSGPYAA